VPDTTMSPATVLFDERQRLSPSVWRIGMPLTLAVLGGSAAIAARQGQLAQAVPGLAFGAVVVLGVFTFIGLTTLVTRITTAQAVVAFRPFKTLRLRPEEIGTVGTKSFGLFDGGIGYHISFRSMALTAQTGTGVLITKPDGYRILVGTQHPDALVSALLRLQRSASRATRSD